MWRPYLNKNASLDPDNSVHTDGKDVRTKAPKESIKNFELQTFLANCSHRPGVYQMYDAQQTHLYIG